MKRYLIVFLIGFTNCLSVGQTLTDSLALEAFMDGLIKAHMDDKNIAGATLAIVHNGKVVLKKGYGFADIQRQLPVNPDSTLFRVGSISKMFVWTSVMQLVADGKLDLNKDVNTYLKDFQIPATYDQAITLKHLMTHTPGFEDHVLNLFAKDETSLRPLADILKDELPYRVRAPYSQASYSNHGTAIAAHIVEVVSGISFYDYVQQKIIGPLKMSSTSFEQPLPEGLKKYMSSGYRVENNILKKQGFEFVPLYPVGAASASAESITHLMLAFLGNGQYEGYQMLDSATLEFMKGVAHQHHPNVNPMRYGFIDGSQNGVAVIGHGGDTFWFHSMMALLPEHQTGFFFSTNTDTGGGIAVKVFEEFMDQYFPDQRPLPKPLKVSKHWLEQFAGEYIGNRYPVKDLTKISMLFGRIHVAVEDSTGLRITSDNESHVYVPMDSSTFREEFNSDRFAFAKEDGQVKYAFIGWLPILALEKVVGVDLASTHYLVFLIIISVSMLTVMYWPLVYFLRKNYQRRFTESLAMPWAGKMIAWINYFFLTIFLVGLALSFSDPYEIVYGVPMSLKVLLVLPFFIIITTIAMCFLLIRLWMNSRYRLINRLCYGVLCVISWLAIWQLNYWNLIGFNY